MLTRAFNVIGLVVRNAEWKAHLAAFAAKRSVIAMLGYLIAAIVALGGLSILLGAGYVTLVPIVGVPYAMAAVGVFLLLIASLIWLVASQKGKGTDDTLTEHQARENAERDAEQLRSALGLTDDEPDAKPGGPPTQTSEQSDVTKALKDPKVAIAAAVATLGLVGPGRLFRTVRIAAGIASIAAIANRVISDNEKKSKAQRKTPIEHSRNSTPPKRHPVHSR
ncbi:MAG: hypothetical protein JJU33_01165 [Phycisphaerales bacterium]|nr:hypothetical protein [Phycisphaerales bacterium]